MTPEEQKHIEILGQIQELNNAKKKISYEINELLNQLAGVSAKIGELGFSLRQFEPPNNMKP